MSDKYLNEAFVGNKNVRGTFSKQGELLRLYYPYVDYQQFINFFRVGVKVNDSGIIYLHNDINNKYSQSYVEDTNILNTEIENTYFNLVTKQTDFVMLKENVLVKKYVFLNNNKIDLNVDILVHSGVVSTDNNMVSGRIIHNGLIQYTHDYSMATFSNKELKGYRVTHTDEYINSGILEDHDYIGLAPDSGISYNVGTIKPGEQKEFVLYVYMQKTSKNMDELLKKVDVLQKVDVEKEFNNTKKYWKKYVEQHDMLKEDKILKTYGKRARKIYIRTILLYPLLLNEETGGISSALEVDEKAARSGRYSYCWPRDAVFVTKAMDELGMIKETEKFYKSFCKETQNEDGMWEQRFFTDGTIATGWCSQIDETASIIYGVYEHYNMTKDKKFIFDNLKMCENAMQFLIKYLEYIFNETEEEDVVKKEIEEMIKASGKEKEKAYKRETRDLWETVQGVHLYSLASIYAAFNSMIQMYEIAKDKYKENRLRLEQFSKNTKKMNQKMEKMQNYISENMYDENYKLLYRNNKDRKMDISILGSVVPFEMFSPKEKKVKNTVEKINMTLKTYTGGYIRFEDDGYIGGMNPWPVATLWMALYYLKINDKKKAKECLNFVINTSTDLGFLGEQIDNSTGKPNWVIGLRMVSCNVYNIVN